MALFKCEIIEKSHTTVIVLKEKPTGKAAYEWAQAQAVEIFGDGAECRYYIEEQPAT